MKNKIPALLIMIMTILFIDLQILLANRLSLLVKLLIIGVTAIGQFVSIITMLTYKPKSKQEKKFFSLTQKFYGLLVFSATSIYTVGIWLITPEAPGFSKPAILGVGLAVQVGGIIYYALKKVQEVPDERFYANLGKSASVMFALYTVSLLLLAACIAAFGAFPLHAGLLFITVGASMLLFGIVYFVFEKRG